MHVLSCSVVSKRVLLISCVFWIFLTQGLRPLTTGVIIQAIIIHSNGVTDTLKLSFLTQEPQKQLLFKDGQFPYEGFIGAN